MNKEQAYIKIKQLVDRFNEQLPYYKKADYNETQTRREFIDPFFKALGWDIDNEQGLAEAYKDVIHEYKLRIKQSTKAPDYCFTISGQPKFFVEAKKPSVYIKEDNTPAYQVKRYGWNAKLSISIVTDFEEFAIYDCTKKPNIKDKATLGRIKYLTFNEYLTEFDFLWETFAKERVLRGSFDKFVKSDAAKKGTTTVDYDFLQSMEEWRKYLATSIAINNHAYAEEDINFVVQQTLDRIIFLRICEDRSIEPQGRLKATITTKGTTYNNLFDYFKEADAKYNSGLFDFKKDKLSASVIIDNKVLKTIITELEESPYLFNIIPVEILGYAYEQFLGKVIRITPGHRVKIEEKPEVRKAGGVFYTPKYIVDYIVQNTVGKIIEGKTAEQVSKIKILDPACGSGSFLLGAYEYLLKWHTDFFHKKFPSVGGKAAGRGGKNNPLTPDGNLTSAVKKQILINNIFGVDLDEQAVEVTKLSLLLKCLEGETNASILDQMTMFKERVLPNLDSNIKSGNSLIDTDFYDYQLDFGEERKIKPFNWQKEFPAVFNREVEVEKEDLKALAKKAKIHAKKAMEYATELEEKLSFVSEPIEYYETYKSGGFDIVIGNPPYGAIFNSNEVDYLKTNYVCTKRRVESYTLFVEKALWLLNEQGEFSYIIPDTLLNLEFTLPVRKLLLNRTAIKEIVSLPSNIFKGATVDTIIVRAEKTKSQSKSIVGISIFNKREEVANLNSPNSKFKLDYNDWKKEGNFNIFINELENNLLKKIENSKMTLSEIADIFSGIKAYEVGKGTPAQTNKIRDEKPFTSAVKLDATWMPFFDGKNIGRYQLNWIENNWIKYGKWLAAPRNPENFKGQKILIRKITGKTIIANYIEEDSYCNTLLFVLKLKNNESAYKPILAILNSFLIGWYFRAKFQISHDDTFPQIMMKDILEFPIPEIDTHSSDKLNNLVNNIIMLKKEMHTTSTPNKKEQLQSKINYCDDKINELVYNLYQLSKEEIVLIENSLK